MKKCDVACKLLPQPLAKTTIIIMPSTSTKVNEKQFRHLNWSQKLQILVNDDRLFAMHSQIFRWSNQFCFLSLFSLNLWYVHLNYFFFVTTFGFHMYFFRVGEGFTLCPFATDLYTIICLLSLLVYHTKLLWGTYARITLISLNSTAVSKIFWSQFFSGFALLFFSNSDCDCIFQPFASFLQSVSLFQQCMSIFHRLVQVKWHMKFAKKLYTKSQHK